MQRTPGEHSNSLDRGRTPSPSDAVALRARLEARSRELDEQSLDLIRRRTELEKLEQGLSRRQTALERREADAAALLARVEEQTQALHVEHEQALVEIAKRVETVRGHERELERRTGLARDEAVRQRAEIDALRQAAEDNARQVHAANQRTALLESDLRDRAAKADSQARARAAAAEADLRGRQAALEAERAAQAAAAETELHRRRDALDAELQQHKSAADAELGRHKSALDDELRKHKAEFETIVRQRFADVEARLRASAGELKARAGELDARSAQIETQSAELRRRSDQLAAHEAGFKDREAEVHATASDFEKRRAELLAAAAEQERAREAWARREAEIRQQSHELERRATKARDEIVRERQEVESLRHAAQARLSETESEHARMRAERDVLDARLADCEKHEQRIVARARELDGQSEAMREHESAVDAARARVEKEHLELDALRNDLKRDAAALDQRQKQVAADARKLEKRGEQIDKARAAADRQIAEIESRRKSLAEHDEQLRRREAELRTQAEAHDAAVRELAARDAAAQQVLTHREGEIRAFEERLAETQRSLHARQAEFDALRDQMAMRDADSRQRALAIEVQADELDRRQTVIDLAEEDMLARRAEREADLTRIEREWRARTEQVERAEASILAAPRRWLLRAAGIAAVAAAVAVVLWLNAEQPLHRATVRIGLRSDAVSVERALRQHAAGISSPDAVNAWLGDDAAAREWADSCRSGLAEARIALEPPAIDVSLSARDAPRARRLLEVAATSYIDAVNAVMPVALLPAAHADLLTRREAASADLNEAEAGLRQATTMLAVVPPASRRDELLAQVGQLRETHAATIKALAERRDSLVRLKSGETVGGVVSDEQLNQSLAADALYSADLDEYRSEAVQFRSEAAVGLTPVGERLAELRRGVEQFSATVADQRAQTPPPSVSGVLEELASGLSGFAARVAAQADQCAQWRASLPKISVETGLDDVERLLASAYEACTQTIRDGRALADALRTLGGTPVGGAGGATREMVTLAALQSDLAGFEARLAALAEAAHGVDRRSNFRLSAHQTRLAGVQSRLAQRRDMIRDALQRQADQASADQRENSIAAVADEVTELESRRDKLATQIADGLDALRGLDHDILERRKLESDAVRHREDIARSQQQLATLDAQIADARRGGPQPDRAAVLAVSDEMTAGQYRIRNAALAGVSAFGGTWLLCALMLLKNPLARRKVEPGREPLAAATSGAAARS